MSDLIVGRADRNVAALATVTGTAEDADYPAAYLVDGQLARPAKLTTTTGGWVLDFGSAQRIDLVAFGPHNLTAALANVAVQGNASDSWGAPTLNAPVTTPAYREDGQSVNPWVDLTGVAGYSTSGFRYWRLNVGTANAATIAVGEIALYSQMLTVRNVRVGVVDEDRIPVISHRTLYGVETTYHLGVATRRLSGEIVGNASDLAALLSWYRSGSGRSEWHTVILDSSVNDARFVRFESVALAATRVGAGVARVQVAFEEVSRGLRL